MALSKKRVNESIINLGSEPIYKNTLIFDKREFDSYIIDALVYYRKVHSEKSLVKRAKKLLKLKNIEYSKHVPDSFFINIGILSVILEKNVSIPDNLLNKYLDIFEPLNRRYNVKKPKLPPSQIKPKLNTEKILSSFLGEIEHIIDQYLLYGINKINIQHIPKKYFSDIESYFSEQLKERTLDLTDNFHECGYSKGELTKVLFILEKIVSVFKSSKNRPKRKLKPIDRKKLVSKLRYKSEYYIGGAFLDLEQPLKILNSSKILVYDTVKRKIGLLISDNNNFTVRGTSIYDVDLEKSFYRTIRDPDSFFYEYSKLNTITIRNVLELINKLSTKNIKASGRFNENMVILKIT